MFCILWNCFNYYNSKTPETIRNFPQPTDTIQNHPETTQNYLNQREPPPPHRATSYQILPCFSAVDFEHYFSIRKAELGKNGENLAMIMNYKGKLWTFPHNVRDYYKTSLKHMFEWDCIIYKGIESFNICFC